MNGKQMRAFEHKKFGSIRAMMQGGEPWFLAADICRALKLSNPRAAMQRLYSEEKAKIDLSYDSADGIVQSGSLNIVNESGMRTLVFNARTPAAREMQKWITCEVIPALQAKGQSKKDKQIMGNEKEKNMDNEQIRVFENEQFGKVRTLVDGDKVLFCGKDVAEVLGYTNPSKALADHCKGVTKRDTPTNGGMQQLSFIPESDVYRLVFRSKLPNAERFADWVAEEVLPTIRKTGGFVANEDMFVDNYLPFADEATKALFRATLNVVRQQNKLIESQRQDIGHKQDVIGGLVANIDLATKRQRITQIVRHGSANYAERYNLLYQEFEKKYHCNLTRRMETDRALAVKPKLKNKMDYIDRVMDKIPQLYEIACKLFESDVEQLKTEWEAVVTRDAI